MRNNLSETVNSEVVIMHRRFVILLLGLVVLASGALAQETVKIELKFNPGEVLRYKMVINMNMSMEANGPSSFQLPNVPINMVIVMKQRTKRVLPNGDAEVNAVIESMRMAMGDKVQQLPVNKIPVMTMVMSPSGEVKDMKGFEKFTSACGGMDFVNPWNMKQFGMLPSTELLVGESWSQSVPFPMGGSVQVIGRLLSANEMVANTRCALIRQEIYGNLDFDKPIPAYNGQSISLPPGLKMQGKIKGASETYFSTEKGRMIRTDGNADIRMNMNAPSSSQGSGGSMFMNMRMKFQMYLVPSK